MKRTGYSVQVGSDKIAVRTPFLYIIFSKKFKSLYIGETFGFYGGMGRLSQHLSNSEYSTFRKRLCETFSYDDIEIGEVSFLAIPFGEQKSFRLKSNDHRAAVEYLSQYALNNWIIENRIKLAIISRVRSNGYCKLKYIKLESEIMFQIMSDWVKNEL